MVIQFAGTPLAGKRETLQILAKRVGHDIEAFDLHAPASKDWPALSVHGLAVALREGVKIECFSGGVPWNAESVALTRADAFVLTLDPQTNVLGRNRDYFARNREGLLAKPRIYQITKGDLAPSPCVLDLKEFGRTDEPVIETNLMAGTGFDSLLEEILNLARDCGA